MNHTSVAMSPPQPPQLVDVYQRIWSYHEERKNTAHELIDRHAAYLAVKHFQTPAYKFPDCVGEDDKLIACGLPVDVLDYPRLQPTRAEKQRLAQAEAEKELLRDVRRSRKDTAELRNVSRPAYRRLICHRNQAREDLAHWWNKQQGRQKFARTAWKFAVQKLIDVAQVTLDEARIVACLRKRKLDRLHASDAVTIEFNRLHDRGWTEVFLSEFIGAYSAEAKAIGLSAETIDSKPQLDAGAGDPGEAPDAIIQAIAQIPAAVSRGIREAFEGVKISPSARNAWKACEYATSREGVDDAKQAYRWLREHGCPDDVVPDYKLPPLCQSFERYVREAERAHGKAVIGRTIVRQPDADYPRK